MSVALPKLTWEDFLAIPPDGKRHEYWIVDPEREAVEVYRRGESGRFERAAELAAERDERLESPLLPGLALPLVDLFAS